MKTQKVNNSQKYKINNPDIIKYSIIINNMWRRTLQQYSKRILKIVIFLQNLILPFASQVKENLNINKSKKIIIIISFHHQVLKQV